MYWTIAISESLTLCLMLSTGLQVACLLKLDAGVFRTCFACIRGRCKAVDVVGHVVVSCCGAS